MHFEGDSQLIWHNQFCYVTHQDSQGGYDVLRLDDTACKSHYLDYIKGNLNIVFLDKNEQFIYFKDKETENHGTQRVRRRRSFTLVFRS